MALLPCPVSGCWGLHGAETSYYHDTDSECHVLEVWPVAIEEPTEPESNGPEGAGILYELAEFESRSRQGSAAGGAPFQPAASDLRDRLEGVRPGPGTASSISRPDEADENNDVSASPAIRRDQSDDRVLRKSFEPGKGAEWDFVKSKLRSFLQARRHVGGSDFHPDSGHGLPKRVHQGRLWSSDSSAASPEKIPSRRPAAEVHRPRPSTISPRCWPMP